MLCPRCRQTQEDGLEECRNCGVVFARYRPRPVQEAPVQERPAPAEFHPWFAWLRDRMFTVEPSVNRDPVVLRGAFLLVLAVLAIRLLAAPMRGPALVDSFLHWIDLPFHEAGHVIFRPFGDFLHILGGTLGQLLVPFIVAAAFLKEENPFGAAVGTWWLGQSFLDCSPYIADARSRTLMLLSGETGQEDWEGHDWYQLLSRTGTLAHDLGIARLFWLAGAALMTGALAWGGWILWRQWQGNNR